MIQVTSRRRSIDVSNKIHLYLCNCVPTEDLASIYGLYLGAKSACWSSISRYNWYENWRSRNERYTNGHVGDQ